MYCKNCGKEIAEDSKFCKYCGVEQDKISTKTSESYNKKVIGIPTIKIIFSTSTKLWIVGYGLWVVLHLYWIFAGLKSDVSSSYFQPFTGYVAQWEFYYDMTEFIVYVIGLPLLVWGIIMLIIKYKNK